MDAFVGVCFMGWGSWGGGFKWCGIVVSRVEGSLKGSCAARPAYVRGGGGVCVQGRGKMWVMG